MAKSIRDQLRKALIEPMKKAIENFNKQINKGSMSELTDEVKAQIKRGISPVEKIGRFEKYSKSYREAIKDNRKSVREKSGKVSPVDMTLKGTMLKSLDIVPRGGKTYMEFDDPKAYYHNNSGAGKKRVIRRLLPDKDGESFNSVLQRKFVAAMKRIVKNTKIR
jgi:hypothetical protein